MLLPNIRNQHSKGDAKALMGVDLGRPREKRGREEERVWELLKGRGACWFSCLGTLGEVPLNSHKD